MTDLPTCRWREVRSAGTMRCHSQRFIAPPNRISADFCRGCPYPEGDLPNADPRHIEICQPERPGRDKSRIAVATMHTPEIAEMGKLAAAALRVYAQRHAYTAVVASNSLDPSRPPHWSKIVLLADYLTKHPRCQWLMWIDSDAVITKPERSLDSFLHRDVDFLVGEDIPPSPVNTGVFFVRNVPAVMDLFRRAYAKAHLSSPHWGEQKALAEALRESPPTLRKRIVPRRAFNSFAGEYQEQDFILHFAGCSHARKLTGVANAVHAAYGIDCFGAASASTDGT